MVTAGIGIHGSEPTLGFRVMDCFTARLAGDFIHRDSFGVLRCSSADTITLIATTIDGVLECTTGCLPTTAKAFITGRGAEHMLADSMAEAGSMVVRSPMGPWEAFMVEADSTAEEAATTKVDGTCKQKERDETSVPLFCMARPDLARQVLV